MAHHLRNEEKSPCFIAMKISVSASISHRNEKCGFWPEHAERFVEGGEFGFFEAGKFGQP
jgi:hypothetical protein